jgi:hypothetical protein
VLGRRNTQGAGGLGPETANGDQFRLDLLEARRDGVLQALAGFRDANAAGRAR